MLSTSIYMFKGNPITPSVHKMVRQTKNHASFAARFLTCVWWTLGDIKLTIETLQPQLAFTCSESATETLEIGVK